MRAGGARPATARSTAIRLRAALAIAIENPQVAVTFLPLACSGSTIDLGFFNPLRARECPPTGSCASNNSVPQMVRLNEALDLARKTDKERKLDAILLTIGANDIWFSGLVANVITDPSTERTLFKKRRADRRVSGRAKISSTTTCRAISRNCAGAQALSRRQPAARRLSSPMAIRRWSMAARSARAAARGFDVHPAFNVDAASVARDSDFVEERFLPRLRALATCDAPGACRDPAQGTHDLVDSIRPNSPIMASARVRRAIRPSTANASWKMAKASKAIPRMPPPIRCAAICAPAIFAPMRRARAGSAPPMTAISPP